MDIGGKFTGTVSGAMNMMGNFGGFVSPVVLGYVVTATGNWNLAFYLTAGSISSARPAGCSSIRRSRCRRITAQ